METLLPIIYAVCVLAALGGLFGLLLAVTGKKFAVEEDPRAKLVRGALGGANCGACGYAGCDAFAVAVAKGSAPVTGCTAGGKKVADAIAEIMGTTADVGERKVARVRCRGSHDNAAKRYDYAGINSCQAAAQLAGGPKQCSYGCLGFGDCAAACKFNSITVASGIADINDDFCTGCGACVRTCPRNVITLIPKNKTVVVLCQNPATGKAAMRECKTACIGCRRCEKNCPSDAITVKDGVARIDNSKCTRCGACVVACPMHCIANFFEGLHESYDWE
jgi:electron transport complex protein RnfB